jgi:hypothetical protein
VPTGPSLLGSCLLRHVTDSDWTGRLSKAGLTLLLSLATAVTVPLSDAVGVLLLWWLVGVPLPVCTRRSLSLSFSFTQGFTIAAYGLATGFLLLQYLVLNVCLRWPHTNDEVPLHCYVLVMVTHTPRVGS